MQINVLDHNHEQKEELNVKYRRQIFRKETGNYFMRMANIGNSFPKCKSEDIRESLIYPLSAIGLVEYCQDKTKETQFSCGSIIAPKLILTLTPPFSIDDNLKEYEEMQIKYIKNKQFKQNGIYETNLIVKSQKDEAQKIEKQKSDPQNQSHQLSDRSDDFFSKFFNFFNEQIDESQKEEAQKKEPSKIQKQINGLKKQPTFSNKSIDDFIQDAITPQPTDDINSVYFYPDCDLNSSTRYKAKTIHYFSQRLLLPEMYRMRLPFVSQQCALIELQTQQDLQQTYGSLGFDFHYLPSQRKGRLFCYGLIHDKNGHMIGCPVVYEYNDRIKFQCLPVQFTRNENGELGNLRNLILDKNRLTIKMIALLTRNRWMNLNVLSLCETGLDNGGIAAISKADWPNLSSLGLANNYITSQGLNSILSGNWVNLLGIDLKQNLIGNEDCRLLLLGDWTYIVGFDLSLRVPRQNQNLRSKFISKYPRLHQNSIFF